MLMERIMGAFTFKRQVYADVEKDSSFTNTAWAIVAAVAVLIQIPAIFSADGIGSGILGAVITVGFTLLGFAVGAYVIAWIGKSMFQADVTFEEVVRTLGLAYVWNVVGIIPFFPIICVAWILGFASWFIAAREALELETGQTILVVIIGWAVVFLVTALAGVILGILGLGASALTGAFSG